MSDLKYVVDSSLQDMRLSTEKKQEVLRKCREMSEVKAKGGISKAHLFKRYAVVASACFILCIGGTAAAKMLLWDDFVAERYQVATDEELQQKTMDEGLATTMITSDEDNGVKIEVMQTVATNNNIDIYLKIQAENEEIARKLVDTNPRFEILFENSQFGSIEGGMVNYYTGEGMETCATADYDQMDTRWSEQELDYEIYNITASVSEHNNLNGDTIHLSIDNFVGNSQTSPGKVVEGSWDLSWKIQAAEQKHIVELNKEYNIYGKMIPVDKVVINETGVKIYLPVEDIVSEGLHKADVYLTLQEEVGATSVFDEFYESAEWRGYWGVPLSVTKTWTPEDETEAYEQIENGTYQGEYIDFDEWTENPNRCIVGPLEINAIKMSDGSLFDAESTGGSSTDTEEYYIISQNYAGYLNAEDVKAIRIGDCWIDLSDVRENSAQ